MTPNGNLKWFDKVATPQKEESYDITTDHLGNVYVAGMSYGSLNGSVFKNSAAFVLKISDESVPEPASSAMAITGMVLFCVARRNPRLRYAD